MRTVIGRRVTEVDVGYERIARSCRVVVDLGTGDGRAVIERARAQPDALVVGIDASAAGMADASRRAARSVPRGGVPNALFVVAAAEQCRRNSPPSPTS